MQTETNRVVKAGYVSTTVVTPKQKCLLQQENPIFVKIFSNLPRSFEIKNTYMLLIFLFSILF